MNTQGLFNTIENALDATNLAADGQAADDNYLKSGSEALAELKQRVADLENERERLEQLFAVTVDTLFEIRGNATCSRSIKGLVHEASEEIKTINSEFKIRDKTS